MTPEELLGEIAATVASSLAKRGETGIRLQEVTPFDYQLFLKKLVSEVRAKVALAGVPSNEINRLSKRTHFPASHLTGDLEVATVWRNDARLKDPIIIVAFIEQEKLGTFHRFAPISDEQLYAAICEKAKGDVCPNQVLSEWWSVLGRKDIMRQLAVRRLAEYYLYLLENKHDLPDSSRRGLYLLGLLPSRTFFDAGSAIQLLRRFRSNRQLLDRVETLSNNDRSRLSIGLRSSTGPDKEKLEATIGRALAYSRSGSDADRKELWSEDVTKMFEARKAPSNSGRSKGNVSAERIAADAILMDDDREVIELGQKLREALKEHEVDPAPRISLELKNRDGQASVAVSSPLLSLLKRAITPDSLGGIFRSLTSDSLEQALDDLDEAEFQPFLVSGEKTADSRIRAIVSEGYVEPDLLLAWESFCKARSALANEVALLALSPLVALASDKDLMRQADIYLASYERVLAILKDRYEYLSQKSPKGVRTLAAQLMAMDVVLVETKTGVKALLSPLHPLHLWKFVRLAQQMHRDRATLDPGYKAVLGEHSENLPHFVTAVFVPEGLVDERAMVLPESGQIQTLPTYQQSDLHFSGAEAQDKLVRVMEKFVLLYHHARACLRICLVDPPKLGDLLEDIAEKVLRRELDVQGLLISIYRTLDRPISLGDKDQQLEAIAEVFANGDEQSFVLEFHPEKITYADIVRTLRQAKVHVLAVFDPSTARVGQFIKSDQGVLHPLVLPKQFQYDPMEDQLEIIPAATGGIFDLYHSIQSRLNNTLSGSQFGIGSALGGRFPKTIDLLSHCTWLVIADRLMDAQPLKGGHMISYDPGKQRDLIVLTETLTKFEREFDYQLRQQNFDPTPQAIRELIESSGELIGEGLLGLVRTSERD